MIMKEFENCPNRTRRFAAFGTYAVERLKKARVFAVLLGAFILFSLASFVWFAVVHQIRNMLMALLCAVLVLPVGLGPEYLLHMRMPTAVTVMLLVLAAGGILLGPCFDFYFLIPSWDDFLHTLSGFLFSCFGCAVMCAVVQPKDGKRFAFCVVMGMMACLAVLLLWEMVEYAGTTFLAVDMQEDCLVDGFHSFFLAGTHSHVVEVDNITKTVIYYGNGQVLELDGYLDLGLIDTLNDLLVGVIGAVVFGVSMAFDRLSKGRLHRWLLPTFRTSADAQEPTQDA